jgi:hypothetical protein
MSNPIPATDEEIDHVTCKHCGVAICVADLSDHQAERVKDFRECGPCKQRIHQTDMNNMKETRR